MAAKPMEGGNAIKTGDRVILRKPHACGTREWEVVRVGADIGIRCLGCARRVLMPRSEFNKRLKTITPAQE